MFMKSMWVPRGKDRRRKEHRVGYVITEALLVVENVVVFPPSTLKSAEIAPDYRNPLGSEHRHVRPYQQYSAVGTSKCDQS